MVASESGSPLQPPQAHPGYCLFVKPIMKNIYVYVFCFHYVPMPVFCQGSFPQVIVAPKNATMSWRLCGITSISAFLFSNVDDVLTYVEGWQRATIGHLSNLHRRTLRKLAMYNEKSKFRPVFSVQNFSSTYMIIGYDDCYNLTEMKWHIKNMTSPGGAMTRRHGKNRYCATESVCSHGPKAISLVLGFGGNCIHHPAKKIQQSRDLDTFIADVISSASSKVVAAFAERREEKISVPVVMRKQVFGFTHSIHAVRGQAKEPNSLQRQTATYIRQALIPLRTSTINGNNVVANRDSRHHNYHVTTSQLSATGHIRRPFARAPSNCKKLSYWVPYCNKTCFGMGEVAWIQTCKAYTVPDFERSISGIKEMRPEAYKKLEDAGFEKWSRAYCPANRYNYMTSNCTESINALTKTVRKVPITMLMDYYRDLIQRWYIERRYTGEDEPLADELSRWVAAKVNQRMLKSATWTILGIDRFRVYQVKDNKTVHVVDLVKRECSCINWQLSGLPRGHVCAMSRCLGMTKCNKWAKA
ncbi:hypothetical protein Tco_1300398 [Tanacetum coccineum]